MIYAIIAAGEGSRLKEEGVSALKPMVVVNSEMLIDRLIRVFLHNRATRIIIIVNDHSQALVEHIKSLDLPVPLQLVIKSTPSSFHSFYELVQSLGSTPEELCLATTDTIFREEEFSRYIDQFINNRVNDGLFAVTSFIDDETPLYVAVDETGTITGITDNAAQPNPFISAGIYCLRKPALAVVAAAMQEGVHRMRNYQKMLLQHNLDLKAWTFSKVLDIDHVSDIEKAEEFLKETRSVKHLQHVNG